jgi:hypothetical protein
VIYSHTPLITLRCVGKLNRYVVSNHVNAGVPVPLPLRYVRGRRLLDWLFRSIATPFGLSIIGARIVAMKQCLMTPELAAYNKKHGIISGCWVVNARRDKVGAFIFLCCTHFQPFIVSIFVYHIYRHVSNH